MPHGFHPARIRSLLILFRMLAGLWAGQALSQGFKIVEVSFDAQGHPQVRHESRTDSYFVLYRGPTLAPLSTPVALALGTSGDGVLIDTGVNGVQGNRFYRIQSIPRNAPLDLDGDGIDDLYELEHASFLNPLLASDGASDFDGDGVSNADEYRAGTDPETADGLTHLTASPENGEQAVSVNREVILRFSSSLAAGTLIGPGQLNAEFGGRTLLGRVELAPDRRTVWLFHLEPLPASARIRVTFDGTGVMDEHGQEVDADGDGQPGGVARIDYETASGALVPGTAVIGRVFASELLNGSAVNRPLAGVTITVDGQEQTLRTVTGPDGNFRLDPAPVGEFFVHVDGRTSPESTWPGGAYYPFIGKKWKAVAGRPDNLATPTGEIFLPRIDAAALTPVSATETTPVTFPDAVIQQNPQLAGVMLRIPPNALFNDQGTRGGRVGIAPVAPDRLPEPAPAGLNFPVVITVQTDGAQNFDQPVPVRFPNLPDPATGGILPPGGKTGLWSFNHDTGRWELQGTMTVSADGRFVDSDAGVGIRQPGWHGVSFATWVRLGRLVIQIVTAPPPCADGTPCDDGDPCTINDRCQNGVCVGDLPEPACPPIQPAPVDFSRWTETANDGARGGSFTQPAWVDMFFNVCFDRTSKSWRLRIPKIESPGTINTSMQGSQEPTVGPEGNVTADNYCQILADMSDYSSPGNGGGRGAWHLREATRAHEYTHLNDEWKPIVRRRYSEAKQAAEALSVPCFESRRFAELYLGRKISEIAGRAWNASLRDWDAVSPAAVHDTQHNDLPYQRGQEVLNQRIQQIRDFAREQGFPACPGGIRPPTSPLADAWCSPAWWVQRGRISRAGADEPVYLTHITAQLTPRLLQTGGSGAIVVTGHFTDGSTLDLTSGTTGTQYSSAEPRVATVDANGRVTAVAPGVAGVSVIHQMGSDMRPIMTMASVRVADPEDQDDDGLPDEWETGHGLNPGDPSDAHGDRDGDGVDNLEEFERGLNPSSPDTDGDGIPDRQELILGTDPLRAQPVETVLQKGLHYYVVMDLDRGEVVFRGVAGNQGIAHESLILAPNRQYREWIYQASTGLVASEAFTTPAPGQTLDLPAFLFREDDSGDEDHDHLSTTGEFILGTDASNPDTDGDGVPDGAEVAQGTDPSDGQAVRTGILYSADTAGTAVDIQAENDLAVLALEDAGIAVFNVFDGLNPTLIAQVNTPGSANRVALAGRQIAVADGTAGLTVVDLRDPAAARVMRTVQLGGTAISVAVAGPTAFAGTAQGDLVAVDLESGLLLSRIRLGSPVVDIVVGGDNLYALTETTLHSLDYLDGTLELRSSTVSPTYGPVNHRLFVGGRIAYAVQGKGVNLFDLSEPTSPRLRATSNTTQFGWKQMVANGSGLAVAAVSPNQAFDGPHNISLYDVSDSGAAPSFLTEFVTPGVARAVALYNGLAYVADGEKGLQVINYTAYDRNGVAPGIQLTTSFASGLAEEGKLMRLTAAVSDDVQVRQVQFFLDGTEVVTDGNYPFEVRLLTPLIGPGKTRFTVRARAMDTGGNVTWSDEQVLDLVPDATPPRVRRSVPFNGALVGGPETAAVFFSEPMDPATMTRANIGLTGAGPDNQFGTADDVMVGYDLEIRDGLSAAFFKFASRLAPGSYRLAVSSGLRDSAGNSLATTFTSVFRVFDFTDADQDGVPDALEPGLGLDPTRADSDGDGVPDGLEDPDQDGLPTAWEILAETDPMVRDTDGNGVPDGNEDPDGDGLSNGREALAGTHPRLADTDGDGWNDEAEITGGSDPLNPSSVPVLFIRGTPVPAVQLASFGPGGPVALGIYRGMPRVSVGRPGLDDSGPMAGGTHVGRPSVRVGRTGLDPDDPVRGTYVGHPTVTVGVTGLGTNTGVTVGRPPIQVTVPAP